MPAGTMYEPAADRAEEDGVDVADVQPASAARAVLAMAIGLQSDRQNS